MFFSRRPRTDPSKAFATVGRRICRTRDFEGKSGKLSLKNRLDGVFPPKDEKSGSFGDRESDGEGRFFRKTGFRRASPMFKRQVQASGSRQVQAIGETTRKKDPPAQFQGRFRRTFFPKKPD
jgi:hypothetical protein